MKLNYIPGTEYKVYSYENKFSFGVDAILLSYFAKIKRNLNILEIGAGTGVVSLRMNSLYSPNKIYSVEIQKDNYDLLIKNIYYNKLENIIYPINANINDYFHICKNDSIDIIVTNPPYYKLNSGIKNLDNNQFISRYEIFLKLEDIFKFAKYKLKSKGELYMINRPGRLIDIIELSRKYGIEPKTLVPVVSKVSEEPKMILIKFVKNAGANFVFEKPILIYDIDNEYTKEIREIYYGK